MTQAELASMVGITRPYLSDIENGKRQVSGEVVLRIARSLAVKVEDIFFAQVVQHDGQEPAMIGEEIEGSAGEHE